MRIHRRLAALSILLIGLSACGSGESIDAPIDPNTGIPILPVPASAAPILTAAAGPAFTAKSSALTSVAGCDDIFEVLRKQAIVETVANVRAVFASAWRSRETCGQHYYDGGAMADSGVSPPTPTPEHSETNNQVVGVDEADIVKTDGNYVYLIIGGRVRILASWPAEQTKQLAELTVSGTPLKLFQHGDRLLVYSAAGNGTEKECTYGYSCAPTGDGRPLTISVFDIADRQKPRLVRTLTTSSSLLAARRVGTAVHTVVTASTGQPFGYLSSHADIDVCSASGQEIFDAYKNLLDANVKKILQATPSDVVPSLVDTVHGARGQTSQNASPLVDCAGFLQGALGSSDQLTSVVSLAIDNEQPAVAATIFTRPGFVFASQASLYLAVPEQAGTWGWYDMESQEATALHKFELGNTPPTVSYQASGLVKGRPLYQFSMDEQQGMLRIATTTGHLYGGAHNTVSVLEQQGPTLAVIGQLDNLAPGEDIRAVRFDGPKGYVVTFKKTDPLFVIDLSQPSAPKLLGELKIPGFSTYMQRMDENHLLTIGYDADDQGSFAWFTGVLLQIFDVTDPTHPLLEHKQVIGTRGSSSEALTNHLAFTYYAPKNLLSIPMTICENSAGGGNYGMDLTFSGLLVYDTTVQSGFSLHGRVAYPLNSGYDCGNWWTDASSQVKRSLIIDDYVLSLTDTQLKVNHLSDLGKDVVSLSF